MANTMKSRKIKNKFHCLKSHKNNCHHQMKTFLNMFQKKIKTSI